MASGAIIARPRCKQPILEGGVCGSWGQHCFRETTSTLFGVSTRQCLRDACVSMTCRHMGAFLTAVPQPRFQSLGQPCKENTAILSAAELTLPQGMGLAGVLAVDSTVT